MPRIYVSKIELLDACHPGLRQKVDAMFDSFESIKAVTVMIQAEYGERIGHSTITNYRKKQWCTRRKAVLAEKAATAAYRELASEGRN